MPTFTPPTDNFLNLSDFEVTMFSSDDTRLSYRLLNHFAALPRGRNVYKLDDGTYTENEPNDMETVIVTYLGGHSHEVSADEASSLTAAGYGDNIS